MTVSAKTSSSTEASTAAVLAAVLSAALGCCTMGVLTLLATLVRPLNAWLAFYAPAGALSGEAALAVAVWLGSWLIAARLWKRSSPAPARVLGAAYALLACGLLLCFPPFVHLLLRR